MDPFNLDTVQLSATAKMDKQKRNKNKEIKKELNNSESLKLSIK